MPHLIDCAIVYATLEIGTLGRVAVSVGAVCDRRLEMSVCVTADDVCEFTHLQIAYALWQPRGALTGIAGSHLVDQHSVVGPRTHTIYFEILVSVDAVVFKQSAIDHFWIFTTTHAQAFILPNTQL